MGISTQRVDIPILGKFFIVKWIYHTMTNWFYCSRQNYDLSCILSLQIKILLSNALLHTIACKLDYAVCLSKSQSQVEIPYYVTLFNILQGKTILNFANLSLEIQFFLNFLSITLLRTIAIPIGLYCMLSKLHFFSNWIALLWNPTVVRH